LAGTIRPQQVSGEPFGIEEPNGVSVKDHESGRKSFGASQVILPLGDDPADCPHVLGPFGGVEGRGPGVSAR